MSHESFKFYVPTYPVFARPFTYRVNIKHLFAKETLEELQLSSKKEGPLQSFGDIAI